MQKIALCQFNPIVGNVDYNVNKIIQQIDVAFNNDAILLITPELAIPGYGASDLYLRNDFYIQTTNGLQKIVEHSKRYPNCFIVVGSVYNEQNDGLVDSSYYLTKNPQHRFNSAFLINNGKILGRYDKHELPNYAVFHERRYFKEGTGSLVFKCGNISFGIVICEDIWHNCDAVKESIDNKAQVIICLSASPFSVNKHALRLNVARKLVNQFYVPLVYVNQVGGQDDVVFDGRSFVLDQNAQMIACGSSFGEELLYAALNCSTISYPSLLDYSKEYLIYNSLVVATRDYVRKNGFSKVALGLSGGIDSALVLAIAVDALGCDNVVAVMMQSLYTSEISLIDARALANNLKVEYIELSIDKIMATFEDTLSDVFHMHQVDTTEENLQARIRGNILMAISNKFGYLVLSTGNKSELATGYATLYGDMAGAFAPLKDVSKTCVYSLSKYRNTISFVIPERIITRAPSAELRHNQTDQETLPEYSLLDNIIELLVEYGYSTKQIIDLGHDKQIVAKVAHMIQNSEYKRRQGAIGPKVTACGFCSDWLHPITQQFKF